MSKNIVVHSSGPCLYQAELIFPIWYNRVSQTHKQFATILPPEDLQENKPDLLHPIPLQDLRFLVDVSVSRVGSLLRMADFDCAFRPHHDDADIAATAVREGRVLLSRDRNLLKRRNHWPKNIMIPFCTAEAVETSIGQVRTNPAWRASSKRPLLQSVQEGGEQDNLKTAHRKFLL